MNKEIFYKVMILGKGHINPQDLIDIFDNKTYIKNIDYELLDKQIQKLLVLRFSNYAVSQFDKETKDALDGIIHLIEEIQDENEKEQNER